MVPWSLQNGFSDHHDHHHGGIREFALPNQILSVTAKLPAGMYPKFQEIMAGFARANNSPVRSSAMTTRCKFSAYEVKVT